jgi:hypothetical protein
MDPGPGKRDVTSTGFQILNGRLRGSGSAGAWGDRKIIFLEEDSTGVARADGLALWTVYVPMNKDATAGIGWATGTGVTTPLTTGHHWLMNEGYGRVSIPGTNVALTPTGDVARMGQFRTNEYLVCVVLRAQGAFYLVSSHAAHTNTGVANSTDRIGIPQFPSARLLWIEDSDTTTPMYPHFGILENIGPPNGHAWDNLYLNEITTWQNDQGLATFLDRITRADSTSTIGPAWTNDGSAVFGVSSNKAYCQTVSGHSVAWADSNLTGDGIWQCKITVPTTTTNQFGFMYRRVNSTNYMIAHNGGGNNLLIHKNVGGSFTQLASIPRTWTAAQTNTWTIITKGNYSQVYIDGLLMLDWVDDAATTTFTSADGFGPYVFNNVATGGRWDDFIAAPNILTLPEALQVGPAPHIFTAGSTIASDAFTAANGTAINGRTPDVGNAWTTSGAGWDIQSNAARNSNVNSTDTGYYAYINCGTTDVDWEASITSPASGDWFYVGALLRFTDVNNWIVVRMRMGADQPGNDEIEVVENIAGAPVIVMHQQFGDFYALNTTYTFKVQLKGDLLHLFCNGEPFGSYIVRVLTSNNHGMYHNSQDDGSVFNSITIKAIS